MTPTKLIIPPRPGVLMDIQEHMNAEEPCIQAIADLIKQDVSLYAVLLSAVNSPWMGLPQSVESAEKAIALMGLDRVFNLLQAVIVRSCFKDAPVIESFWNSAAEVAAISSDLAKRYGVCESDQAYTTGMLHNAGIPIMLSNVEGYEYFLNQNGYCAANEVCVLERQQFGTDHYLQGALMAKSWYLPKAVSLAIRYQPIAHSVLTQKKELPADVAKLLAIISLAKNISNEYHNYWKMEDCEQSELLLDAALRYLDICNSEFTELKEDHMDDLVNEEVA